MKTTTPRPRKDRHHCKLNRIARQDLPSAMPDSRSQISSFQDSRSPSQSPLDLATNAITYALRRIRYEPNLAYHMGPGTEVWELLTTAVAAIHKVDIATVREHFDPRPSTWKCHAESMRDLNYAWQEYIGPQDPNSALAKNQLIEKIRKILKEAA